MRPAFFMRKEKKGTAVTSIDRGRLAVPPYIGETYMNTEQNVSFREKVSYMMTSYGYISISSIISTFILYYYTDVALLSLTAVSALLFLVRLFAGAIELFIGHYMDRHQTKYGKYKGYLIYWSFPFCLASVFLFLPLPIEGEAVKIIWYAIVYVIWSFLYGIIKSANLPLLVAITDDPKQRYSVNSAKILGSILASLAARYVALELVGLLGGGDEGKGYTLTVILFAVVGFFFIYFPARWIIERNSQISKPPSIVQTVVLFLKNKKIFFMLLFFFAHQMASSVKGQASIYYMKYIVSQPSLTALFLTTSALSSLIMQPVISFYAKKIPSHLLIIIGYLGGAVSMLVMGFSETSIPLLFFGNVLYGVTIAFPANLLYVYVAELADYCNGASSTMLHSLLGLSSKIAIALGGSLIALVLSLNNYVPNLVQNSGTQEGITFIFIIVTMLLYIFAAIFAFISFSCKNGKG